MLDNAQAFAHNAHVSKNPHAKALGKLGGKAGRGKAKARTAEQARAAAMKRWAARKPKQ